MNLRAPSHQEFWKGSGEGGREGGGEGGAGAGACAGAQSAMTVLALGSGRRLASVQRSGAAFLQTLLWILCAAVCGAEQCFNVEVREPGFSLCPARAAPEALRSPPGLGCSERGLSGVSSSPDPSSAPGSR